MDSSRYNRTISRNSSATSLANRHSLYGGSVDISTDSLLLVDGRLIKTSKKQDLSSMSTKTSYNFPNGETFTPRVNSQKRNKPKRLYHALSFTSVPTRNNSLRLNSVQLERNITISRSFSMVLLGAARNVQDIPPLHPVTALLHSSNKQTFLARSPSLNNVRAKNKELASMLRTNRNDTPTNIDISALNPSLPTLSHKNSLTNNRYQKGSNNIVILELTLIHNADSVAENTSSRSMSLGNNSSYFNRAGSDTTPNSNPSSISNFNFNRSNSTTPETSISASDTKTEGIIKPDNTIPKGIDIVKAEMIIGKLDSSMDDSFSKSKSFSTSSSKASSFASADEFLLEDKLELPANSPKETIKVIGDEGDHVIPENSVSDKISLSQLFENRKIENISKTQSNPATSPNDTKISTIADSVATETKNVAMTKLEISNLEIDSSSTLKYDLSHLSAESSNAMNDEIGRESPIAASQLEVKQDSKSDHSDKKLTGNDHRSTTKRAIDLSDEQNFTPPKLNLPMLSLTSRRNTGLSLSLGPVRLSFVDLPIEVATPQLQESLPSVLKSAESDRRLSKIEIVRSATPGNSPGSRSSIYSPVQLERFFSDDQEEVPPRGDLVIVDEERESFASSAGSVLPSPKVLQTKFLSEAGKRNSEPKPNSLESMLSVVDVNFDKLLPESPAIENVKEKWTKADLELGNSPTRLTNNVSETNIAKKRENISKPVSGFRKMFKMFSKDKSESVQSQEKLVTSKKKPSCRNLKLISTLSPTFSLKTPQMGETAPHLPPMTKVVREPSPVEHSYDLPALNFEGIFFNDVLVKFDEVEKQAQTEVELLKKNKSINNLFLKDDELSKDQIANQQQKDSANSDDFLPLDTAANGLSAYYNSFTLSEELITELPMGKEHVLVLTKDEIGSILGNPNTLTYGFLRSLRQFQDSDQVTVKLTGFNPSENPQIKNDNAHTSILTKSNDKKVKNRVRFADTLHISETFDPEMYKRYNRSVTQYYLTEFAEVNRIKNELNFYKCHEMLVHQKSQCNTHFFY